MTDIPTTNAEFYEYIRKSNFDSYNKFETWITTNRWHGKDKLESCVRVFARLGCIPKISDFKISKGIYDKGESKDVITTYKEIFYKDGLDVCLNDKGGGGADLHGFCEKGGKTYILAMTIKNKNLEGVTKLDIDELENNFKKFYKKKGVKLQLGVCSRSITKEKIERSETDTKKKSLKDAILLNIGDIYETYCMFKKEFGNVCFEDLLKRDYSSLKWCVPKFNQKLGSLKNMEWINSGVKKIGNFDVCRSGKTYQCTYTIILDSCDKGECNYCIILNAYYETDKDFLNVLGCYQLRDFKVHIVNGKTIDKVEEKLGVKNIFIISPGYLKNTTSKKCESKDFKRIEWLRSISFDIIFMDEAHYGGCSVYSRNILEYYGENSVKIFMTATFSKPLLSYNISINNITSWTNDDNRSCHLFGDGGKEELVKKHGDIILDIVNDYSSYESIRNEYNEYVTMKFISQDIRDDEVRAKIIERIKHTGEGESIKSRFLGNWDLHKIKKGEEKLQNESQALVPYNSIFGEYDDEFDEPINKNCIINQIKEECTLGDSRCIGDESCDPIIILCFLDSKNIGFRSNCLKKMLENKHRDFHPKTGKYTIVNTNSKEKGNIKDRVAFAYKEAKSKKKQGVLIHTGVQGHMGITFEYCDIVLMMNEDKSSDLIVQKIHRCMTTSKGKKFGFVVDMNIHRQINTIANYAMMIKPKIPTKKAMHQCLKQGLLGLNTSHFKNVSDDKIINMMYDEIYCARPETAIKPLINDIRTIGCVLSEDDDELINKYFTPIKKPKSSSTKKLKEDSNKDIGDGIIKTSSSDTTKSVDEVKSRVDFMDIILHIIPFMCLLCRNVKVNTFESMYMCIMEDKELYDVFLDQMVVWWGTDITTIVVKRVISIYIKSMSVESINNIDVIVKTIKKLFEDSCGDRKTLSRLIDKYMVPLEEERKKNAQHTTISELRQEMLDKIDNEFWKGRTTVYEPFVGHGGFVIDMIDRMDLAMKDEIEDDELRYKIIVEERIYFSDINPTNIYICKSLINRDNEYNSNYFV